LELEAGIVLANRYRITRPLGRGGMGEVFAAENIHTGRPVAIKLLRSESKNKASAMVRFRREARAAGSINSDHVTQVLDVHEDDQHGILLVFELLEGESLIDRLKRSGPIRFEDLHSIAEQVWIGLADAHRAGIIHRDLKPSNVYLERRPDGTTRVKILDFGVSKLPREMGGDTLTEMGQSLGTFSFMPPEQIQKAKTVDHRADIYACTTLVYQALTGHLPYQARNILAMVELKAKTEPRQLSEVMDGPVDPRLEAFIAKGLAREPAQRFQTAQEALAAWRELRPGTPSSQPALRSMGHAMGSTSASASAGLVPASAARGPMSAPMPQEGQMGGPASPRGGMLGSVPGSRGGGPPQHAGLHAHGPPASSAPQPYHAGMLGVPGMQGAPGAVGAPASVHAPMQPPSTPMPPPSSAAQPPQSPLGMMTSDLAKTAVRPPQQQPPDPEGGRRHGAPAPYEVVQPGRMLGPYGTALVDHATGQPIQPYGAPPAAQGAGRHELPHMYDESSTGPSSQEMKTQVYQSRSASAMPFPPDLPGATPTPPPQSSVAPGSSRLPLIALGILAIIAALAGAVVLLWSMGKLPLR